MSHALRIGFVLSGVLHLAVAAPFVLREPGSARANDDAEPLTLELAMFLPSAAASPAIPSAATPPAPPPRVEPVATEPVTDTAPTPTQEAPAEAATEITEVPTPPAAPEPAPMPDPLPKPLPEPEPETETETEPRPPSPSRPEPKPATPPPEPAPASARPDTVTPAATAPAKPQVATSRTAPSHAAQDTAEAVGPEPRPAPPPVRTGDSTVQERQYLAELAARINRAKYYPRVSRRLGEEGTTVLAFVIRRNGELGDIQVVESAGHARLDEAARKTMLRVSPFRPMPAAIARDDWQIRVPIVFSLRH
jgi:TonB family protein